MSGVLAGLSPALAVSGIIIAALILVVTRRPTVALPTLLDFLLAAGLLRLSATAAWTAIGSTALIVVIRKLASFAVSQRHAPAVSRGA